MSICDKCYAPGQCCKYILLISNTHPKGQTFWDDEPVKDQMQKWRHPDDSPLPFEPLKVIEKFVDENTGRPYSKWVFSCPNLLPNGRCGDYENRPSICRNFEPMSDNFCVHYQGAEGTGEGL